MTEIIKHMTAWKNKYNSAFKSAEDFWKFFFLEMTEFAERLDEELVIENKPELSLKELWEKTKLGRPYEDNIENERCPDCGAIGLHGCTGKRIIPMMPYQDMFKVQEIPPVSFGLNAL